MGLLRKTRATDIEVEKSGNILVTGETKVNWGTPGSRIGYYDYFVARHAPDGFQGMAQAARTRHLIDEGAVKVDSLGNFYVAGGTTGDMDGNGPGYSRGSSDLFLVKFSSD